MKRNFLILFFLSFAMVKLSYAQNENSKSKMNTFKSNSFLSFPNEKIKLEDFFNIKKDLLLLGDSEMRLIKSNNSETKQQHYKYQQYYQNIPVYNAIYWLHESDNYVINSNGVLYPDVSVDNQLIIQDEDIIRIIQSKINADQKSNKNNTAVNKTIDVQILSKELVITDRIFPKFSSYYVHAYKVIASSKSANKKTEYIIDTQDGHVIFSQSRIHHADRPGKARTHYYGIQDITADSVGPKMYYLRDNGRNITTYTNKTGENKMLSDDDNNWDQTNANLDETAFDAHYGATKFHDMMLQKFNYKGVDGKGGALDPIVQAGASTDFVNAYWDGENATFGNGDCNNGPLVTLSIVGHEFTHGVTEFNSGLIYDSESGALNESYSDIFGKAVEYYYDRSRFSWDLDPLLFTASYSRLFRSFSDPNKLEMPKAYQGKFWEDFADVHTNSSVLNHWFYLMIEGKTGVNEFNEPYTVKSTPITDVLKVLMKCQTDYLTPTSGYPEMAKLSLMACAEIYTKSSAIYKSMEEAWKAVNVTPGNSNPNPTFDITCTARFDKMLYCESTIEPDVIFELINVGTEVIPAQTTVPYNINLLVNGLLADRIQDELTLTKDLLPGQKIQSTLSKVFAFIDQGSIQVYMELDFDDDELFNNVSDFSISNKYNPDKNDLQMNGANVYLRNCAKKFVYTNVTAANVSCDVIAKGEKFDVIYSVNGNKIYTSHLIIDHDVKSGEGFNLNDSFPYIPINGMVRMEISYSKDPEPSNNVVLYPISFKEINKPITIDFNNEAYKDVLDLKIDFGGSNLITYQNNSQYGCTGFMDPLDNFSFPCTDLNRNFNSPYTQGMNACLDLSTLGDATLSFELTQFYYDSVIYAELRKKTSAALISWQDATSNNVKLISGQTEGQKIKYEYNLPKNFTGNLDLSFFVFYGDASLSQNSLKYDAILLDNLIIKKSTAVIDPESDFGISISPNPSTDYIDVRLSNSASDATQYSIKDMNGRTLISDHYGTTQIKTIDISLLNNGMYSLSIIDGDRHQQMKFVKMK